MTDHYEMPHARADECPHAGVGKACRPCRDRFERTPITPDERAAMRERAERLHRYGGESQEASEDILAVLDALDTAEAEVLRIEDMESEVRRVEKFLRMERVAARRNLERAEKAEAEVARLREMVARLSKSLSDELRPAPVWDEDTVTEAVARRLHTDACSEYDYAWEPNADTFRDQARELIAVVREHTPVRPDRETVARALREHGGWVADLPADEMDCCADAVLALWPGESRATVQAEALRDAAEEIDRLYFGPDQDKPFSTGAKHKWGAMQAANRVRSRADRLDPRGADCG